MGIIRKLLKKLLGRKSSWEYIGKNDERYQTWRDPAYPKKVPRWLRKVLDRTNMRIGYSYYFKGKSFRYKVVVSFYNGNGTAPPIYLFYRKKRKRKK